MTAPYISLIKTNPAIVLIRVKAFILVMFIINLIIIQMTQSVQAIQPFYSSHQYYSA